MCTWRGSLWPKHPGSYFRHHLSRRHLLADGSGGWSPLAPVHHCTCDTNQYFVAYFIHIQSLKKKMFKRNFSYGHWSMLLKANIPQEFQVFDYWILESCETSFKIVWWFLYTYSVIQIVSRKFSSYRACSTARAFWYFDYLKISIITSPWSCLKGQNREHFSEARDCLSTVHRQWGSHCLSVHPHVSDRTWGCRHGVRTFWSETDCLVALRLWKGENQN